MSTKAQKWARRRNYSKGRVIGCIANLRHILAFSPLTHSERVGMRIGIEYLEDVIRYWDTNNDDSKHSYIKSESMKETLRKKREASRS